MNCREVLELMGEYADGDLGVWSRCRLRLHLWICRNCRRYLSSYRAVIRIAKSVRGGTVHAVDEPIPKTLAESILHSARHQGTD